mgnify:CR=1 FL=1
MKNIYLATTSFSLFSKKPMDSKQIPNLWIQMMSSSIILAKFKFPLDKTKRSLVIQRFESYYDSHDALSKTD